MCKISHSKVMQKVCIIYLRKLNNQICIHLLFGHIKNINICMYQIMAAALSLDLRELSKKGKTFPTISDKFATTTSSGKDGNTRDKPWTKIKMSLFIFSWYMFQNYVKISGLVPSAETRAPKMSKIESLNY